MKINEIKINGYGKLKNKEIKLNDNINIIYGKNESGKSTLLKFILNIFYGTSRNKKGKDISDYEKYKPWDFEQFSGKLLYELDNKDKFEIYREFSKKNPKIFNENGEDISKQFNIDKNKGNEFFYEQTQITEDMFLATSVAMQKEIEIEKGTQSLLIQKISNLLDTGEDGISYKKAIDKLNKRQLDSIGTDRSREKPINIIKKNIEENTEKINELKKYENIEYEIEEEKKEIKNNIEKNEHKNNILKEIKKLKEKNNLENEKIKIKEKIIEENKNKINEIKNIIEEKNEKIEKEKNNEKIENKNLEKNKINNILKIIFIILFLANILWIAFAQKNINNSIFTYIFLLTLPMYLSFWDYEKRKINKKIKNIEKNKNDKISEIENENNNLKNEEKILEKNSDELLKEIYNLKNENNLFINLEKQKIINNYLNIFSEDEVNNYFNSKKIDNEIIFFENIINNLKIDLNKLELKKENIEPQLEKLSNIEEELFSQKEQYENLQKLNLSINLAKEMLEKAYEKMKNNISPIFTKKLSENIGRITDGKYNNVYFNDEQGLTVELESGNYVSVDRLSIGTIDQLYLSLRLAILDEISNEKVPIILDESFAYYDDERLKNILVFLANEYIDRQIILFTCSDREKEILESNEINFSYFNL